MYDRYRMKNRPKDFNGDSSITNSESLSDWEYLYSDEEEVNELI